MDRGIEYQQNLKSSSLAIVVIHARSNRRKDVEPVMRGINEILASIQPAEVIHVERITINPNQCGGRPCIRGMRIRVTDVLELLASGLTREQVLDELPDLETEDIDAVLRYASRRLDRPVLAA